MGKMFLVALAVQEVSGQATPWWVYPVIAVVFLLLVGYGVYRSLNWLFFFPRLSNEPEEEYEEPPRAA
ncbi:MAG: hypothetical protein UY23_C0002G0054 [Candidatus Jorgensenbacteria bacterium GW2011_GWA1_48_11]|uniref:Uncharacterized protein n=1 Tax=Candidatus Jorgensenbacteria bacterium GW2011_GWA1_48_11 TaxID=1618660 RepID=A0A0G1XAH0_9BACT|nr:MAG: hypothetical protein UY23_C0002G0054 [Candidatus Jorgensenbacteria bacterium GW2011_GWA1_48_11]KKW12753.1 MAG: hypothetical protein UY51_C0001G0053 [Candidatus Jorgensenbacteria bacterium GW2011_GWB1_49_9]